MREQPWYIRLAADIQAQRDAEEAAAVERISRALRSNLQQVLDEEHRRGGECDCGHLRRSHDIIGICQVSMCGCQDGEYRTDGHAPIHHTPKPGAPAPKEAPDAD